MTFGDVINVWISVSKAANSSIIACVEGPGSGKPKLLSQLGSLGFKLVSKSSSTTDFESDFGKNLFDLRLLAIGSLIKIRNFGCSNYSEIEILVKFVLKRNQVFRCATVM